MKKEKLSHFITQLNSLQTKNLLISVDGRDIAIVFRTEKGAVSRTHFLARKDVKFTRVGRDVLDKWYSDMLEEDS